MLYIKLSSADINQINFDLLSKPLHWENVHRLMLECPVWQHAIQDTLEENEFHFLQIIYKVYKFFGQLEH